MLVFIFLFCFITFNILRLINSGENCRQNVAKKGGKEGRREGGKEGRREGGKEGRREGGMEERKGVSDFG